MYKYYHYSVYDMTTLTGARLSRWHHVVYNKTLRTAAMGLLDCTAGAGAALLVIIVTQGLCHTEDICIGAKQ